MAAVSKSERISRPDGWIFVLFLALLVLSTLFVALRTQYEREDPLSRGVAFGVTMGIISLAIHSLVDFNLQIPANALTFTVLLAMGWVAYSVERWGRGEAERSPQGRAERSGSSGICGSGD